MIKIEVSELMEEVLGEVVSSPAKSEAFQEKEHVYSKPRYTKRLKLLKRIKPKRDWGDCFFSNFSNYYPFFLLKFRTT